MSKELLKKWLKLIKEYEESSSMVIGFLVVVVLSFGVFGVIKNFSHLFTSQLNDQVINDVNLNENIATTPNPEERDGSSFTVVSGNVEKTHIVESGEGLWQIAVQYYGDGNQYIKIFDANKDQMKSPEDIRVGMELRIPE